jgi:hypothetical protein
MRTLFALTAIAGMAVSPMVFAAEGPPQVPGEAGKDYDSFKVSRLECVIGNNMAMGEHRAWYNGVYSIKSPDQADTPFVPLYAGLNLENFYDARPRHSDNAIFFEPRSAEMRFKKLSATSAELYQPETPYFGVESWTTFELKEPYYIDMTFKCIPRKAGLKGDFLGIFWASYINEPLNKSIYFLRNGSTLDAPQWVQLCTQLHDHAPSVRSESDPAEISFDETDKTTLWNQISPLRWSQPFYYGQWKNMVLIYVFQPDPLIRFAHSPTGGGRTKAGDDTCPAWDFQYVIPKYEVGKEYGFKMRAVYKPWVDRADVLKEVKLYLENK